ncbi:MAG: hypothetical protein J6C08_00165 [Campylobacter sp.]|uniref:hypothetical protein n=1 Tax=Campylobacter sp. TaxID=205 RepID=UPI001B02743F|nr:hypothetical protein [Campylobacter sp.]MBO5062885.1 hypothetical protein [Campylobacter sp.]MBO5062914.1 hypothetical protein [Campylobacter sp.]
MKFKHKFFKDEARALEFNAQVKGTLCFKEDWEYELELRTIEYSEGLKEEFDYLVIWTEEE